MMMMMLKKYMEDGGSVLVLMGEGGELKFQTNINVLLEEYGIFVNTGLIAIESNIISTQCLFSSQVFLSRMESPMMLRKLFLKGNKNNIIIGF